MPILITGTIRGSFLESPSAYPRSSRLTRCTETTPCRPPRLEAGENEVVVEDEVDSGASIPCGFEEIGGPEQIEFHPSVIWNDELRGVAVEVRQSIAFKWIGILVKWDRLLLHVVFLYGFIVLFKVPEQHAVDGFFKIVEKHSLGLLPEMRKDEYEVKANIEHLEDWIILCRSSSTLKESLKLVDGGWLLNLRT